MKDRDNIPGARKGRALLFLFLAYFSFTSFLAGCGAVSPRTGAVKDGDTVMEMEPVHVRARREGEETVLHAYSASSLFEDAAKLLEEGNCSAGIPKYQKLVSEFPDSRLAPLALYNQGLCFEQMERLTAAAQAYRQLVENYPQTDDLEDALFRLAGVYEVQENWKAALSVLSHLLTDEMQLGGLARIEALAKRGACLRNLERYEEARVVLGEVVTFYRVGEGREKPVSIFYYGMAHFELGEILLDEMGSIELPADESIVASALEEKCQRLLDAQAEYTRSIKVAHPHWAAAAAYRIGHLYRTLFDDILNAPVPEDLSGEAKEVYLEVLQDRIKTLLTKATRQWERTLKMAKRLHLDNPWVDKTIAELAEIKRLLNQETDNDEVVTSP